MRFRSFGMSETQTFSANQFQVTLLALYKKQNYNFFIVVVFC